MAIALQGGFVHRRLAQIGAAATLEPRRYVFVSASGLSWTHQDEVSGGNTSGTVSCVVDGCQGMIAPDFLSMVAHVDAAHALTRASYGAVAGRALFWVADRIREVGDVQQQALLPANVDLLVQQLKEQDPLARQVLDAEAEVASRRGSTRHTAPVMSPNDDALVPDGSCVMRMPLCNNACKETADGRSWTPTTIASAHVQYHQDGRHRCRWSRVEVPDGGWQDDGGRVC
ncbi:unnamed protein product [Parajaminaea phylloscopi]